MKPRPASQRAMAAKPTQRQLRAAFASQAPIDRCDHDKDELWDVITMSPQGAFKCPICRDNFRPKLTKRRKIDGLDSIDDLGEK